MYFINCFLIYSFLGFLLENIICLLKKEKMGSGILYGPWTPIYGIGCVLILLVYRFLIKILELHKWLEVLIFLLVIMFILTFLEWIGGVIIEKVFHTTFWDYSQFKFSIGKYVALEISLSWTLGSLFVIYIIQPFIDKYIFLIPNFLTFLLLFLMLIDIIIIFSHRKTHR